MLFQKISNWRSKRLDFIVVIWLCPIVKLLKNYQINTKVFYDIDFLFKDKRNFGRKFYL